MLPQDPNFDPDAPATADGGLFGLDTPLENCLVRVFGVPFDATTSYRRGAALGPEAILAASHQVDLYDAQQAEWPGGDGRPWAVGIHMVIDEQVRDWNEEAGPLAEKVIELGGRISGRRELEEGLARVNEIGSLVNQRVHDWTAQSFSDDSIPVIVGGDHSVPYGAIIAASEAHPGLGILHIDAHADLREAYEGFTWSHASILHNLLRADSAPEKVLSVGLRDLGEREYEAIGKSGKIRAVFDHQWAKARLRAENLAEFARREVECLPGDVWLTIDIDGLEPALCPSTGTPVPGGLAWNETLLWLEALVASGRRIVGLDLCEVSPGTSTPKGEDSWDAIVGARLLYKAIGAALASNSSISPK
ncbi:MAG: agmatinase [Planctomycetota bacterium]